MGFKVNASAETTVAKLNNIIKRHSIKRNIDDDVGEIAMDRWGNFEFTAYSRTGTLHDCKGVVRVIPTGPRECLVEFVSREYKCDREGHTGEIEEDLRKKLNDYWYE